MAPDFLGQFLDELGRYRPELFGQFLDELGRDHLGHYWAAIE